MLITFQSIVPVFIAIFMGNGLRSMSKLSDAFWSDLEKLCYYLLYPSIIFITIYRADFSGLSFGPLALTLAVAIFVMCLLTLALWPVFRRLHVAPSTFSSVFQSSIRWNGFLALVLAENMFPPEAAALVGLVMAAIIIPVNAVSVAVIAWFASSQPNFGSVGKKIASNPLIIAASLGILLRFLPFDIPNPIMEGLQLLARAALGMGLLSIGAGLRLGDLFKPAIAVYAPTVLKLAVFPLLVVSTALVFGIRGPELSYLALCASVPTAMNGYLLARQMGGDADNYAVTVTVQTVVAFFSIPAVLFIVDQLIGG